MRKAGIPEEELPARPHWNAKRDAVLENLIPSKGAIISRAEKDEM